MANVSLSFPKERVMQNIKFKMFLIIFINIFAFSSLFASEESAKSISWNKLHRAWVAYIEYPSTDNAKYVYELLPLRSIKYTGSTNEKKIIELIYGELGILERQIYASDPNAVAVAFKLFSISDGGFSSALCMILGSLIRINPKLFLQELKRHRSIIIRLDALVGNFGTEYVDKMKAHDLESKLRIEALKNVLDPNLTNTKNECIAALKD